MKVDDTTSGTLGACSAALIKCRFEQVITEESMG